MIGVRIVVVALVAASIGVIAACSSQQCLPLGRVCLLSEWMRSPCEIISFTTTCTSSMDCHHGACIVGGTQQNNENCTVTALYDDGTKAVSHVAVTLNCLCTTNITATDFVPVKGSTCSPPKTDPDASVDDATIKDGATDASSEASI